MTAGAGRRVLVTGGSRGIGAAIAERLTQEGWCVINLDREAPDRPSAVRHVAADLLDPEQTRAVLEALLREAPLLHLVNNAGAGGPLPLEAVDALALDRIIGVNLRGAIVCAQVLVSAMKAAGHGRIVNITSRAALGKPGRTVYSATKAGLIGLTRTWALELGPAGITVNAVGPGPIATELFSSSNPPDSPATQTLIDSIPLRRIGQPDDVAHAVSFFLSDQSSFITGQTLYVCGGLTVGTSGL